VFQGDGLRLSLDPQNSDTLVVDLRRVQRRDHDDRDDDWEGEDGRDDEGRDEVQVRAGTRILVELFNLNNPVAGNHAIGVTARDRRGKVIEVIPPIAFSTFADGGDIAAVISGRGLTGGGTSGEVTLFVADSFQLPQTCTSGQVAKATGGGGTWTCGADNNSGGTVMSVTAAGGLTATPNPITGTGTISVATGGITSTLLAPNSVDSSKIVDGVISAADVDSTQIQRRVTGTCPAGLSIRVIDAAGTVECEVDDVGGGVTAVTASAPLTSSGGPTPNITLPNVVI
jgi:hypothetical protein